MTNKISAVKIVSSMWSDVYSRNIWWII